MVFCTINRSSFWSAVFCSHCCVAEGKGEGNNKCCDHSKHGAQCIHGEVRWVQGKRDLLTWQVRYRHLAASPCQVCDKAHYEGKRYNIPDIGQFFSGSDLTWPLNPSMFKRDSSGFFQWQVSVTFNRDLRSEYSLSNVTTCSRYHPFREFSSLMFLLQFSSSFLPINFSKCDTKSAC